jgi:hypothetical protein
MATQEWSRIRDDVLSLCHIEACDRQRQALLDRVGVHQSNSGAKPPGTAALAARDRAETHLQRETSRRKRIFAAMMEQAKRG